MEKNVRHVLGISGGKDSAALAIYLRNLYPTMNIEYYTSDTGKELAETYQLIEKLESFLGKKIQKLTAAQNTPERNPFDHFLKLYGGFLPSSNARWCTKKLKLEPFEDYVGEDPVISYVGIRGDENREGYISKKSNIQSIFPFRKNIWSEDVILKVLANKEITHLLDWYTSIGDNAHFIELLEQPISLNYSRVQKLNQLLDVDTKAFNHLVFAFLKTTDYPLSKVEAVDFPLLDNDDVLVKDDIFGLLKDNGVGVPAYYDKIDFEVNGQSAQYARSRSGCFFCFYQQKIEWVWLYEQHHDLFLKAMEYEKDGYTWMQEESLEDLTRPERIASIKEEYIKRTERLNNNNSSHRLVDILAEGEGCVSCFV